MNTRKKSRILFIFCLTVFLVHQFLERVARIEIPILDNYLDPLLAMPVILHLVTLERRFLTKNPTYKLPLLHIILYVVVITIFAEVIFPRVNPKLVGDPVDVLMYVIGAGVYSLIQYPLKKPTK